MAILDGYRTYLVAIAIVLMALGTSIMNYFSGQPLELDILLDGLIGLGLLFLRQGIKKA